MCTQLHVFIATNSSFLPQCFNDFDSRQGEIIIDDSLEL